MVPQELSKSDIVKIIELLDKLLPFNSINKQGRGRRKAYYDKDNLKSSILLKLCSISYRFTELDGNNSRSEHFSSPFQNPTRSHSLTSAE